MISEDCFDASSQRRYVDLSLLRPGDVILTFPAGPVTRTWESVGIAWPTGGPYSHATLVLEPMRWYESNDQGGPLLVTVDHIEDSGTGALRLLKALDQWRLFDVYRHDELPSDGESLRSRLAEITMPLSYKRYPTYDRIASDLGILGLLPLRDQLASLFSENVLQQTNRGFFCSEVIAHVYKELGLGFTNTSHELSIRVQSLPPRQVRPSTIADYAVSGTLRVLKPHERVATWPPFLHCRT